MSQSLAVDQVRLRAKVDMHLRIAARSLRDDGPRAAFLELARAAEALPMNGRLAAGLVTLSLACGAQGQAQRLLERGIEEAEGPERVEFLRQHARLARRSGRHGEARTLLMQLLELRSSDRRALAVSQVLMMRQQRWDELDASLEAQTRGLVERSLLKAAGRVSLRRARLWGEVLDQPSRAALRAMQAAQFAEQLKDFPRAFFLRLLWLKYLHRAHAPQRVLEEAARLVLNLGQRVGQHASAQGLVDDLGLGGAQPGQERRHSQQELMSVAQAAEAAGQKPEAAAFRAAALEGAVEQGVIGDFEAQLLRRGAWVELAALYRHCLRRHLSHPQRGVWATRLAELLESEMRDLDGAASLWAEVAKLNDDALAQAECVRLLGVLGDPIKVRQALNASVERAASQSERIAALMARAEDALTRGEAANARVDFAAVAKLMPFHPGAAAGLAELAMTSGDLRALGPFENALALLPLGTPGRAELYRRLARVADGLRQRGLSRASWAEVRKELPDDEEAAAQLLKGARDVGDEAAVEQLLHDSLEREPHGAQARKMRLELVSLHERHGRHAEARQVLKEAVAVDPGHREAWLTYAERLLDDGASDERVVWVLEQAAAATADPAERALLWRRLARYVRQRLRDEARAQTYESRAVSLESELTASGVRRVKRAALRRGPSAGEIDRLAQKLGARVEPQQKSRAHVRVAPQVQRQLAHFTGETLLGRPGPPVPTAEVEELEELTGEMELADEVTPSTKVTDRPQRAPSGRNALFEQARANPLDAQVYRRLAAQYRSANEALRADLMNEIAAALDGEPLTACSAPRLMLNATERASLMHSSLRGEGGELLRSVGLVLCRLDPMRGKNVGGIDPLTAQSGKGAPGVILAMRAAVRILGVRAPELYLSADQGPPVSLVFTAQLRLVVGKLAVVRALHEAELRFFAARALLMQEPELLVLRTLGKEQLQRALSLVAQVAEGKGSPLELKMFREAIAPAKWNHFKHLAREVGPQLKASVLGEGARHSINRAGLVVCGAVGPAVASLRAKKARPDELIELLRFAASDRYFMLRARAIA